MRDLLEDFWAGPSLLPAYEGFIIRLLTRINLGVATTPPGLGYPKNPQTNPSQKSFCEGADWVCTRLQHELLFMGPVSVNLQSEICTS